MKNNIWSLSCNDVKKNSFIFYEFSSQGIRQVRDLYSDMPCSQCGKIDEISALKRGLAPELRLVECDVMSTLDFFIAAGPKLQEAIMKVAAEEIEAYPLVDQDMSILLPKKLIAPDTASDAFTCSSKCNTCGRFSEIVWDAGIPPLPNFSHVSAYMLESRIGMLPYWIISEKLASTLKHAAPKIKGLVMKPF